MTPYLPVHVVAAELGLSRLSARVRAVQRGAIVRETFEDGEHRIWVDVTKMEHKNMADSGICPHCGQYNGRLEIHIPACPEEPERKRAVIRFLRQHSEDGCIMKIREYEELQPEELPSCYTLIRNWGNWEGVAAVAGLNPPEYRKAGDEEVIAELQRLADELHNGEIGPNPTEYKRHAAKGALTSGAIYKRYGDWEAVLELAGLRLENQSYYRRRRRERNGPAKSAEEYEDEVAAFIRAHGGMREGWRDWPLRGKEKVKNIFNWRTRQYEVCSVVELQ